MSKSIRNFVITSGAVLSMLLLSSVLWGGTTGKISGRIVDEATGQPLAGANVMIIGTTLGAAADAEGDYFIINVPPGTYEVQSTMIGYQNLTQIGVVVRIDHTTPADFGLTSAVLELGEVNVIAEREVVKMDQSASTIHASTEEIMDVPMVLDIMEFIGMQAGIEGEIIRGGGMDQTQFMVDGLIMVDNRLNEPINMVNLSTIQEVSIIRGGFNAEYGNVRSGMINIVTKEGDTQAYHGSADFRYRPPGLKHGGPSILDADCYWLKPYLDPEVMWKGTDYGWVEGSAEQDSFTLDDSKWGTGEDNVGWSMYERRQNQDFKGWEAVAEGTGRTPEQCVDLFIWNLGLPATGGYPGANEVGLKYGYDAKASDLGSHERDYGDLPDVLSDISLSGPVPIIGRMLGDMTFFASARHNSEGFGSPYGWPDRRSYKDASYSLKLISRLTPRLKVGVEALYGEINSLADDSWNADDYVHGGNVFSTSHNWLYAPDSVVPWDVYRSMFGLSVDHSLSANTFYNLRINRTTQTNKCTASQVYWRESVDDARVTPVTLFQIDTTDVTNAPFGFWFAIPDPVQVYVIHDGGGKMRAGARDESETITLAGRFDLTSQVNKYHQVKAGFEFTMDDIYFNNRYWPDWSPGDAWATIWAHEPRRYGAYIQDKFEFEGMIANVGLRWDMNDPNCEWYNTVEKYPKYFKLQYAGVWKELIAEEYGMLEVEGHSRISPRLGISHPISDRSKLYFNYGHAYSMPSSSSMYRISESTTSGVSNIGNPGVEPPRTVSYELGFDSDIGAGIEVHLAGFYKDVSNQTSTVSYENIAGDVIYNTYANQNYADIRGFELEIRKTYGRWITGWFNYMYQVNSRGTFGRSSFYEDIRLELMGGLRNPAQNLPLARPRARGNIIIRSPADYGPIFGGISLSLLGSWRLGDWVQMDPLGLEDEIELSPYINEKDRWEFDARLQKGLSFGQGARVTIFADIQNVFDLQYISSSYGSDWIGSAGDREDYLMSLRLPIWGEYEWYEGMVESGELIPGDDKIGDIKSKDKPYIDMPNLTHLTFRNPRSITVGITFNF
ncbi:TonB-dependent receptor domain-containing protein [Candidatus Neomarinimicrobiota bacterium]